MQATVVIYKIYIFHVINMITMALPDKHACFCIYVCICKYMACTTCASLCLAFYHK